MLSKRRISRHEVVRYWSKCVLRHSWKFLAVTALVTLIAGSVIAAAPEVTKIEIWAVRDPQEAAAIALAAELGYYKAEGLEATVKWIVSGTDMASLAASGQVNLYGESAQITGILRDKGVEFVHVLPLADISGTQGFVLGPKIKLNSPKDLEGKKVGMAAGSGVEVAVQSMAQAYGVDFSKIVFVNLSPPDQVSAVARGDIVAMATWEPWLLEARKLGGKLYFTGNRSYIGGVEKQVNWMYLDSGLNVKVDFLKKNPNTVKAVMRALIKATDYINHNPLSKVAEVASRPLNVARNALAGIMKENIYRAAIDQHSIDGLKRLLEWSATRKYISRVMTPGEVLDARLLKEIAPDRVKVTTF
jgi:NitT/TauT family transport system substrate-binding protein